MCYKNVALASKENDVQQRRTVELPSHAPKITQKMLSNRENKKNQQYSKQNLVPDQKGERYVLCM